jgi:hypothetical protein
MSRASGRQLLVLVGMCATRGSSVIAIKRVHGIKPLELQAWFAWTALPVLLPDARR